MVPHSATGQFLANQVNAIIADLRGVFMQCSEEQYIMPLPLLSGSSIGEHTRHIIDFFNCLVQGSVSGKVNYARRNRERKLETDKGYALEVLIKLAHKIGTVDMPLEVEMSLIPEEGHLKVISSLYREMSYNIEHAIHHMAILKIGLRSIQIEVNKNFGVAPSTINYNEQCVS
jgi:hypothetical protein